MSDRNYYWTEAPNGEYQNDLQDENARLRERIRLLEDEPCPDCNGDGYWGKAPDGRYRSCETCGGHEDRLGSGKFRAPMLEENARLREQAEVLAAALEAFREVPRGQQAHRVGDELMTTPIDRLREQHQPCGLGTHCEGCNFEAWPCDTIAALDALEAEIVEVRTSETITMWRGAATLERAGFTVTGLDAEVKRLEQQVEALAEALRNQGLLQNTFHGKVWHIHDCPASFDFAECHYRCRVARASFALAEMEPYVSEETRRDTEVYE